MELEQKLAKYEQKMTNMKEEGLGEEDGKWLSSTNESFVAEGIYVIEEDVVSETSEVLSRCGNTADNCDDGEDSV
jgi:hypothetical protein